MKHNKSQMKMMNRKRRGGLRPGAQEELDVHCLRMSIGLCNCCPDTKNSRVRRRRNAIKPLDLVVSTMPTPVDFDAADVLMHRRGAVEASAVVLVQIDGSNIGMMKDRFYTRRGAQAENVMGSTSKMFEENQPQISSPSAPQKQPIKPTVFIPRKSVHNTFDQVLGALKEEHEFRRILATPDTRISLSGPGSKRASATFRTSGCLRASLMETVNVNNGLLLPGLGRASRANAIALGDTSL
eukprot:Colp12_sorted_trinity150504_noHs@26897